MKQIKCTKCNESAEASGKVSCLCDKDNCQGQRCSADRLFQNYSCSHCGSSGTPPDTKSYTSYHCS